MFVRSNLADGDFRCLCSAMSNFKPQPRRLKIRQEFVGISLLLLVALCAASASAASKPHVITFGKWISVPWLSLGDSASDEKPASLKVRPLLVDTRVREFTFGPAHDVTDRLFVIRRAFRVNDSLPQEAAAPPHWI